MWSGTSVTFLYDGAYFVATQAQRQRSIATLSCIWASTRCSHPVWRIYRFDPLCCESRRVDLGSYLLQNMMQMTDLRFLRKWKCNLEICCEYFFRSKLKGKKTTCVNAQI